MVNVLKLICIGFLFFLVGCATAQPVKQSDETPQEAVSAMKSVAGVLGGQQMTDEDLRALAEQVKKDEEAQSAVVAITESLSAEKSNSKYCPVTGKRYSSSMVVCPIHGVELKMLEE